jgi:hypothetical protein
MLVQSQGDTFSIINMLVAGVMELASVSVRNLGARQVCTSSTDAACYGDLYQWGRAKDGHESEGSGTITTSAASITPPTTKFINKTDWVSSGIDSNGDLRAAAWADGGDNDICPAGFSVPTEAELRLATTTKVKDIATAFSSFLKLPASGGRAPGDSKSSGVGVSAPLWSRSTKKSFGRFFAIYTKNASFQSINRSYGFSVRCIKD